MTKLKGKEIPMNVLEKEAVYVLLDVSPVYEYDLENKRTDRILGWNYSVANTDSFEKYRIKVLGSKPIVTASVLKTKIDNGIKTFVEFENAVVKLYWSNSKKSLEDSFKADNISVVETEQ